MFFKKRPPIKDDADRELMGTLYRVRDQMNHERALLATMREVDEHTRLNLATQSALFDFLYREARVRQVRNNVVAEKSAEVMQRNSHID